MCRGLPTETPFARLLVGLLVHLRHLATAVAMLREDIAHIPVCEMSIKIQPPKKFRRCLEALVNEPFDGLESPSGCPRVPLRASGARAPRTTFRRVQYAYQTPAAEQE